LSSSEKISHLVFRSGDGRGLLGTVKGVTIHSVLQKLQLHSSQQGPTSAVHRQFRCFTVHCFFFLCEFDPTWRRCVSVFVLWMQEWDSALSRTHIHTDNHQKMVNAPRPCGSPGAFKPRFVRLSFHAIHALALSSLSWPLSLHRDCQRTKAIH